MGISADRYGQLVIDSTELANALSTDLSSVKTLFAGESGTDGVAKRITDKIDVYTNVSSGLIVSRENSIQALLDRNESERLTIERRMASLEERYIRQFSQWTPLLDSFNQRVIF